MPIDLRCPVCRSKLRVPSTALGKKVRCPSCGNTFPCRAEDTLSPPEKQLPVLSAVEEFSEPVSPNAAPDVITTRPLSAAPVSRPKPLRRADPFRPAPARKGSPAGWVISLVVGGLALVIVLCTGVIGLAVWSFNRGIPDAEWQAFSPPDGSFTVRMPGTPALAPVDGKGLQAKKYLLHHKASDSFFAVGYVDLPGDPPPGLLTQALAAERDNLIARLGGTVVSERDVPFGPYRGRELQLKPDKGNGTLIEVVFVAKHGSATRLYVLGTGGPRIYPGTGDAAKFFDSFALAADPPPPPPQIKPPPPPEVKPPPPPGEKKPIFTGPDGKGTLWTIRPDGVGISSAALSPDGKTLAVGGINSPFVLLNTADGQRKAAYEGVPGVEVQVAASPDGKLLATTGKVNDCILVRDGSTGAVTRTLAWPGVHIHHQLAFSPDGAWFAVAAGPEVRIWRVADWEEQPRQNLPHPLLIRGFAFSPDSSRLALAVLDWATKKGSIRVWDVAPHKETHNIPTDPWPVGHLFFTPDGQGIAGTYFNVMGFWDLKENRQTAKLEGFGGHHVLCFSPDGKRLMTDGADGRKIYIWDWPSRQLVAEIPNPQAIIIQLSFTNDPNRFLSIAGEEITLWDLELVIKNYKAR